MTDKPVGPDSGESPAGPTSNAAPDSDVTLVDRGCPVCGAGPDQFCVTPSGKPRSDHKGREFEEAESDDE